MLHRLIYSCRMETYLLAAILMLVFLLLMLNTMPEAVRLQSVAVIGGGWFGSDPAPDLKDIASLRR